jgi:hypothetical protein
MPELNIDSARISFDNGQTWESIDLGTNSVRFTSTGNFGYMHHVRVAPAQPAPAKPGELRRLYRAIAKLLHPDAPSVPGVHDDDRTKLMAEVNVAYGRSDIDILRLVAKRLGVQEG